MDDWEIKKPLGQCSGTGKVIAAGEEYFAALVETPEGLERRDFCAEFWQTNKPQVFCYWKSKLVPPEQKKKLFVDDDMLMAFFERLANEDQQEKVNFRFVLMLILMRKRLLKYDSSRLEQGRELWRLRLTGTDTMADVVNPHLSQEQIDQLSSQVGQILQVDGL
jgi:hypothetical protein